jgi:hypothetical protein
VQKAENNGKVAMTHKKQTQMVGLRVDPDLFKEISRRASELSTSPTSCVRQLVAQALDYTANLPERPPRQTPAKKRVSPELKEAIQVLAVLLDIRTNLDALSSHCEQLNLSAATHDQDLFASKMILQIMHSNLAAVRSFLLGSPT